ncbi:MAG: beta-propeller domain-containing protein [Sandaracinus sp.]
MDRKVMVLFVGGALAVGATVGGIVLSQDATESTEQTGTGDGPQGDTTNGGARPSLDPSTPADPSHDPAASATDVLRPFGSEDAWNTFLASVQPPREQRGGGGSIDDLLQGALGGAPPAAEAAAVPTSPSTSTGSAAPGQGRAAAGDGADDESITNTQVRGVDEGGIVKTHGDHLVVLRRGRLFTIRIGDGSLTPVASIDAPPPGVTGGWYDEMLVSGDTIVVVGYNYQNSGTELGLFSIDAQGQLARRGTYYLRSGDYYSSRNYASRLLGSTLVFYMPIPVPTWGAPVELPAMRRQNDDWRELIRGERVYQPIQDVQGYPLMHTVVRCDLAPTARGADPDCRADAIIGPSSRNFFVSANAVYVWTGNGYAAPAQGSAQNGPRPDAVVYRIPLESGQPGAMRVFGQPTDQLSFDEAADGHLDVLVRSESGGDAMWRPEVASGDVALARLDLSQMTAQVPTASVDAYTPLPRAEGYDFHNRFVGDWVLYGIGADSYYGWGDRPTVTSRTLYAAPVRGAARAAVGSRDPWVSIPVEHAIERIEVMGSDAVVVGSGGADLHFDAIAFDGASARVAGHYVQPGASQGESRTHGFFFRQDSPTEGVLGLPIAGASRDSFAEIWQGSASVLFLQVRDHAFTEVGSLAARSESVEDHCIASCADWYGNARPIFWRGRIFGLLGYELVEGRLDRGHVREVGRTNFYRDLPANAPRPHFGPTGQ